MVKPFKNASHSPLTFSPLSDHHKSYILFCIPAVKTNPSFSCSNISEVTRAIVQLFGWDVETSGSEYCDVNLFRGPVRNSWISGTDSMVNIHFPAFYCASFSRAAPQRPKLGSWEGLLETSVKDPHQCDDEEHKGDDGDSREQEEQRSKHTVGNG